MVGVAISSTVFGVLLLCISSNCLPWSQALESTKVLASSSEMEPWYWQQQSGLNKNVIENPVKILFITRMLPMFPTRFRIFFARIY